MLEKTLESPLKCKEIKQVNLKGNQSWVFTGRTDAEAEAPYFGHLMQRADSLEKTLMLGKLRVAEGGRHRMRWMDGVINSMDMSLSKLRRCWRTGNPGVLQSMGLQKVGQDWVTELTELSFYLSFSTSPGIPQGLVRRVDYSYQNFTDTNMQCSSMIFSVLTQHVHTILLNTERPVAIALFTTVHWSPSAK